MLQVPNHCVMMRGGNSAWPPGRTDESWIKWKLSRVDITTCIYAVEIETNCTPRLLTCAGVMWPGQVATMGTWAGRKEMDCGKKKLKAKTKELKIWRMLKWDLIRVFHPWRIKFDFLNPPRTQRVQVIRWKAKP